jgi:ectoine hydroxylase-related dioxygenase (phytanoyl-CoA dioxygenase family)
VVPGSHTENPNQYMKLRKDKDGHLESYMDPESPPPYKEEGAVALEVPPGSIIVFHGKLLHWSEENTSE